MRRFNPDKELNKIRNGNKNRVLYGIITLLLIVAVSCTYALYQIRHTNKLVFNTVGEFKKRDIYLSVLVDGETKSDFPGKDDGYVFDNIICDKPGIEASFNNETWKLTLTTGTTNKCTVKFITKPYMDESGANYPDLFQGLIPIRYDNNKIYIADYQQKWYDYNNNEWANAVLIDHENPEVMEKFYTNGKLNVNTEITTDDILQMYVWIPRYKYELWNANNESKPKQLINIKFENTIETTGEVSCSTASNGKETCINADNGNWYTHPAFTFGDTQLRGIWVGKFEPSDPTDSIGKTVNVIGDIAILPDKTSMVNKSILTALTAEQKINDEGNKYNLVSNEVDTRVMKNIEWGAMAYLTQSIYGIYKDEHTCNIEEMGFDECEVWANNATQATKEKFGGGTYTGCTNGPGTYALVQWNDEEDVPAKCSEENRWNKNGVKASTTGNVYGIYDTTGGTSENVMGLIMKEDGTGPNFLKNEIESILGNSKYYDLYEYGDSIKTHQRGHLGDATKETLEKFGNDYGGWNNDLVRLPYSNTPWFTRGDYYYEGNLGGVFSAGAGSIYGGYFHSFRSVLSAA